jgi:hypothetical protein
VSDKKARIGHCSLIAIIDEVLGICLVESTASIWESVKVLTNPVKTVRVDIAGLGYFLLKCHIQRKIFFRILLIKVSTYYINGQVKVKVGSFI